MAIDQAKKSRRKVSHQMRSNDSSDLENNNQNRSNLRIQQDGSANESGKIASNSIPQKPHKLDAMQETM